MSETTNNQLVCSPRRCNTSRQVLDGVVGGPAAISSIGNSIQVVWNDNLGSLRYRLAPISDIGTEPDVVIIDSDEYGGVHRPTSNSMISRATADRTGQVAASAGIRIAAVEGLGESTELERPRGNPNRSIPKLDTPPSLISNSDT